MKKKIGRLLFIFAIFTFAFVPLNANADISQGFHTVNIKFLGPMFGETLMMVEAVDASFTNQWLQIDSANQNMLLATALTSVSLNQPVKIWVDNDTHDFVGMSVQTCYSVQMDLSN